MERDDLVMPGRTNKWLVIQAAALGHELVRRYSFRVNGLGDFHSAQGVFPALTCPVQASFRTASLPSAHGMTGNGLWHRDLHRVLFWEQSAALVSGQRIWQAQRAQGQTVALLFWQQSLGECADVILSPAPVHRHHGGMVESFAGVPAGLGERLAERVGRPFALRHYWGPMASVKSSDWIADATAQLLADRECAPDLCLTYLPALDYDLQRYGPESPQAERAIAALRGELERLVPAARASGYEVLVFGDYAIAPVQRAAYPNRVLREAGLFGTRTVSGMLYPDFHHGRAFAVADHEVAFVHAASPEALDAAAGALKGMPGVAAVLRGDALREAGVAHPNAGGLVLVAEEGWWFAYPWWDDPAQAPDYAGHVDIHNKPGYDPCELFFGWPPWKTGMNTDRVRGSHGKVGAGRSVAWASTVEIGREVTSILDLATWIRDRSMK